jgi:hypothetical protein
MSKYTRFGDDQVALLSSPKKVYILYWNDKNWLPGEREKIEKILLPLMEEENYWHIWKQKASSAKYEYIGEFMSRKYPNGKIFGCFTIDKFLEALEEHKLWLVKERKKYEL